MLTLLDVGKMPVQLALKPDGGELFVSNFDSNNFSIVETANNEVGGSYLIGDKPVRGIVTSDNSLLYVSNFGSDTVSVYAIDEGRVIGTVQVGSHPDGLALSPDEGHLLVVNSRSGDVAVVRTVKTRDNSKISAERALVTLIPVGNQPNDIVIKAFQVGEAKK
jgi:YVTN family beta-propeller protein